MGRPAPPQRMDERRKRAGFVHYLAVGVGLTPPLIKPSEANAVLNEWTRIAGCAIRF
jgi:hypothetical protein